MRGIICLEGPDVSGKSTLARYLQDHHNALVIHAINRWTKDSCWLYHNAILEKAVKAFEAGRLVVLDRHWPSEQVYASVFRDGGVKPKLGRLFDRVLRRYCALYVWCLPKNRDHYLQGYKQKVDPGHPYDPDKIKEVYEAYDQLIHGISPAENPVIGELHRDSYASTVATNGGMHSRSDYFHYDMYQWTNYVPEAIDQIISGLAMRQIFLGNYTGRNLSGCLLNADTLIVGDQLNPNKARSDHRHEPWPFHDDQASSYYLLEQLDKANIVEDNLAWVNATHSTERTEALDYCLDPGLKRIVALGQYAYKAVEHLPQAVVIPHPSYAKRFGVNDYADMLSRAIKGVT